MGVPRVVRGHALMAFFSDFADEFFFALALVCLVASGYDFYIGEEGRQRHRERIGEWWLRLSDVDFTTLILEQARRAYEFYMGCLNLLAVLGAFLFYMIIFLFYLTFFLDMKNILHYGESFFPVFIFLISLGISLVATTGFCGKYREIRHR